MVTGHCILMFSCFKTVEFFANKTTSFEKADGIVLCHLLQGGQAVSTRHHAG